MSDIASAPLPALIRYYERLQADPDQTVAEFGFSREKIHLCVVLESDGTVASVDDIRDQNDRGKPIPHLMMVPDGGGRSGSGLKPFFCWDNTGYALGRDNKGKPDRAEAMFAAFRELHLGMQPAVGDDKGYAALCKFLQQWQPSQAESLPKWDELAGMNVVFKLRGREGYVHQNEAVKEAWLARDAQEESGKKKSKKDDSVRGVSLLTGQTEELARLHPLLGGVVGANTMGAAIVSFNLDAFESYGKSQSYNAPVGIHDAFRYTTALNRLLADNSRRVRIGDATVVFWTDREEAKDAEDVFGAFFSEETPKDDPAESKKLVDRLEAFLKAAQQGRMSDVVDNPEAPFYILGLSPNASRLNVRYWMAGTVEQFARQLAQHVSDLEIAEWYSDERDAWIDHALQQCSNKKERDKLQALRQHIDSRLERQSGLISIRDILDETVPAKNKRPDRTRINPRLAGEVSRSILSGTGLPRTLWSAVLDRVLTDGLADPEKRADWRRAQHRRMAILKACLNQSLRTNSTLEAIFVDTYLDKTHASVPYQCGRLMAVLSFSQERALGKVNASVVRRYLAGVVAAPAAMLGRLQVHAEVSHIPKLKGRLPSIVRDEMKQINCAIGPEIPLTFRQGDQSYFVLGFYQQMARLDTMRSMQRRFYRTRLGEWVLSKGERNTANALAKCGVRYVYEPRAVLKAGQDRIPDFFIPGDNRSEDVYIEYVGMDIPEYTQRWKQKLAEYESAGITPDGGEQGRLVIINDPENVLTEVDIISFLKQQRVVFVSEPPTTEE